MFHRPAYRLQAKEKMKKQYWKAPQDCYFLVTEIWLELWEHVLELSDGINWQVQGATGIIIFSFTLSSSYERKTYSEKK